MSSISLLVGLGRPVAYADSNLASLRTEKVELKNTTTADHNLPNSLPSVNTRTCERLPGNLVVNGDFNLGNTGFRSDYIYNPAPTIDEFRYTVLHESEVDGWNTAGTWSVPAGSGMVFIANGGPNPSDTVWSQTIPVKPNTEYEFEAKLTSAYVNSFGSSNPVLTFYANGASLGTTITGFPWAWSTVSATFTTGDQTTIEVLLRNSNTVANGNDMGLDDIIINEYRCELPPECGDEDIDTDGDRVLDSIDLDNDNDGVLDQIEGFEDTDGDGIHNACELDSDNDGISDLVESGASADNIAADSNRDGTISITEAAIANGGEPDRDVDGLMDIFDDAPRNVDADASAGTSPVNNDREDEADYLDLDSDNDGIPDAVEAQPTAGYAADFGTDNDVTDDDSDGDGVIDIYDERRGTFGGSFNEPQNTDGVDEPDYLDTDSDNDTKPDSEEHGLGAESGGPANPTYPDPNGRIDDPQTTLINESGDTSEVAYRELWIPPTIDPDDKDGDGIPNAIDIDDDNDGIIDREENIEIDGRVRAFEEANYGRVNGMGSDAHLRPSAINNCPSNQVGVALYGGSVTNGIVGPNSVDSVNNGICVQVVAANDWARMSVAEFQTFDVLWIGNDDFSSIGGAAAFNVAVASRPVWEQAIDPGNVMIAGGDYDYHYYRNGGGQARAVTDAMIKESADGPAPGLILQAGSYGTTGNQWYQNLGGTFEGLAHAGVGHSNPGPTDVTSHEFNTKYGWDYRSYAFGQSCHGGIYIVPGSPVEQYNLQVMFYYPGGTVPCFMMSDERFPPFFPTRDTDNDNIPDACDLDSDNDGISDLIESGATAEQIRADLNKDGTVSPLEVQIATGGIADADSDGLMDIFDSDITDPSHLTSVGTLPVNNDRDNRHDYIDLDSDADGIPDVIEGKPTKNFGPTYGNDGDVRDDDADTDGAIWVFDTNDLTTGTFGGTFPLPEDTDEDGTPDYLDLDSDNDFALDIQESGLFLSGVDNFADGLDDLVNPTEDYRDTDGIVDLPWRDLADEDDNAETDIDGDVDFREFNPDIDRGDAPFGYGDASNSISEFVELWMGTANQPPDVDEIPFVFGKDALADDLTDTGSLDDEAGVTWNQTEDPFYDTGIVFYPKSPLGYGTHDGIYNFDVEVYNNFVEFAFLDVWIDFDGNQNFDPYELIQSQVIPRRTDSQTLSNLELVVPENAACGRTYARFRISDQSSSAPIDYGGWGEVEDHAITIDCRTDLEPTLEFEPNVAGVNDINFDATTRTYTGEWELSHEIAVRAFVQNNGPQAARGMTLTVQLPVEMDDVVHAPTGKWSCVVDDVTLIAVCNSFGLADGNSEQTINFTGRIPGTFSPDAVIGFAEVEHGGGDQIPENNRVDYDINVIKEWRGTEVVEPFIYAQFSEVLDLTNPDILDRDIDSGDRLATPIQVPVYYGAAVEKVGDPILRTRWCENDPSYVGCDEATDFLLGTIAVESHTTISVTQMLRTSTGLFVPGFASNNLVSAPITTMAARDDSGNATERYAEDALAGCQEWVGYLGGKCVAKQDTLDGLALSPAERAFYEWDILNLTPVVFKTSGGRAIECDNGDGECVYIDDASPGVYQVEGSVNYQVVFHDPIEQRLGVPTHRERRDMAISFYLQVFAPFVEPEK